MGVLDYTFSAFLLRGAWTAIVIAALAMTIGVVLGLIVALMRLSRAPPLSATAWLYVWFMRGTPQLLLLVFLYDALPMVGVKLNSFTTAVLGLGLNEAAFAGEIIRGGIQSVSRTQELAAASLGMSRILTLRRIVLPQAMRAIIPGLTNDAISVVKVTSIASVIFVNELTFRAQQIAAQNFRFFTVFAATAIIYLAINSVISIAQILIERHFDFEAEGPGALTRLLGFSPRPRVPPPAPYLLPAERALAAAATEGVPNAHVLCRGVCKNYNGVAVLRGIDLAVGRGEVVVIVGPSGSGKSTLLRLINHLEPLDDGEITVGGLLVGYRRERGRLVAEADLARARANARIGMVFQHFNLFSHLSALENVVEAPIRVYGEPPEQARRRGRELLARVGLAQQADALPHRLSGGQQQRVAIARALALSPQLMLFDEPTSALDPELVGEVLTVIRNLAGTGITMLVVTHEIRFAREVADRVLFIDGGVVIEAGSPGQLLDKPRHERTRQFLRQVDRVA